MSNSNEASMINEHCLHEIKSEQNTVSILPLRHAILNDELSIEYQSRYDTITG